MALNQDNWCFHHLLPEVKTVKHCYIREMKQSQMLLNVDILQLRKVTALVHPGLQNSANNAKTEAKWGQHIQNK